VFTLNLELEEEREDVSRYIGGEIAAHPKQDQKTKSILDARVLFLWPTTGGKVRRKHENVKHHNWVIEWLAINLNCVLQG
jgi:hypothetical protein